MTVAPTGAPGWRAAASRRVLTAGAVALLHLAAGFALLRAFDVDVVPEPVRSIIAFTPSPTASAVPPPDPPPSPEPPEGASAPPAPRARPSPVAAPRPRIALPEPAPVPPVAAAGDAARSGAADEGAGSGAGGAGAGTGSGAAGSGAGGPGIARGAEKIAGEIRARDYPRAGAGKRDGASVVVHFTVGADGRPSDCRVHRTSGDAEVDAITCRLVVERFRYRPAIAGDGRPIATKAGWKQRWWL